MIDNVSIDILCEVKLAMANKESKEEAFKRLASQRTNAVIYRLRILGHCANQQLYDYSDADVKRIFRAIERELRAVKTKFKNTNKSNFHL